MLKRVLAALVCLITIYALGAWAATSWQLQTKLSTAGGTIKVRNNPTQTAVGTVFYANFTTSAAVPVTVTANAGYNISGLTRNGATIPIGNYTSHYSTTFQKSGGALQSLVAKFAIQKYTVTATVIGFGTITPASMAVSSGGTGVFTASPGGAGTFLVAATGGTLTDLAGRPVTLPFGEPVKITVSNVTGPGSVVATYTTVRADAGPEQRVLVNTLVTLDGSAGTGGDSQLWSQTGGPAVTLAGAGTLRPTFTPTATGTYQFKLTKFLGSTPVASAVTTVTVVGSLADSMRNDCMGCHGAAGIYPAPLVFTRWSASAHKAVAVSCVSCHTSGAMPTPVNSASVNRSTFVITAASAGTVGGNFCATCHTPQIVTDYGASLHSRSGVTCTSCHIQAPHDPAASVTACNGCHIDASGQVVGHPFPMGATDCTTCHNKHNPGATSGAMPGPLGLVHYNNVTSAGYPASYVTSRANCSDCHFDSTANAAVRHQWYSSGHARVNAAAWTTFDFKTRTGCAQCHTTTGFIAYSTGKVVAAWGVASDKTKEVLTCIGCHKDVPNGVVRTLAPVHPYPDDAYLNRDTGTSNVCMSCHSGANNGTSIAVKVAAGADFGSTPFVAPHYLAAGGVLHGRGGYNFSGYAFYSSNSHRGIGIGDRSSTGSSGPCIACHKSEQGGHSFIAAAGSPCANCHGTSLTAASLAASRDAYVNGLEVLKAMLADKGLVYREAYPYFTDLNWGSGQGGADTMGAAFNYVMLLREPGAYAHNSAYARKLISDSIDYLYNGAVTGSLESALNHLVAQQKITPQQSDGMKAYQSGTGCTSCHANTSGSHSAHLASGFGCGDCHETTTTGRALWPANVTHINGQTDVEPGPGRTFSYSYKAGGSTCSSISCHNNGSATWGGSLGCDGCHGAPPATPSHLKHYGGTVAQAAYGSTGIAQDLGATSAAYVMNCGNCHPMDGLKHGNGTVEVELYNPQAPAGSLKAKNPAFASYAAGSTMFQDDRGLTYTQGTCSNVYCHSYTSWTTPSDVPSYATTCTPPIPADLVTTTNYRNVTWESGPLACTGCHANPPETRYPENGGGAGDSHVWRSDDFGYGPVDFLHKNNMYFETGDSEPLACLYCHNDTVKQKGSYTRTENASGIFSTMSDVPIDNFAAHVNGKKDVAFEKQVAVPTIDYPYGSTWSGQKLTYASYDTGTKTCSNVACHLLRTNVTWGTPYKGGVAMDCERCHNGYGGSCPDAAAAANHIPSITSTPPILAAPGYTYTYTVQASEPGGGALTYSLPTAPEGMTVSGSGVITWAPRQDQLGPTPVRLVVASVASGNLLAAEQQFTVTAQEPQVTFTSAPVTTATELKAYSYTARAAVASGMPAVSYALSSPPTGMTITSSTGAISWTPTEAQAGASYPVTVTATSGAYQATQSFDVQVAPSPIAITSTPGTSASTQVAYSYPITATLAGVTTFSYSLITKPTGMTVNSAGVISWTPTSTQTGSFPVVLQVSGGGYLKRQSFTIVVAASPITITSTPVTTAKVGVAYSYPVTATMPGGGTFTYTFITRPTTAMTVNTSGVISWTPTATYVGTRPVTLRVTRGASYTDHSFSIVVSP
ncbi:putative Ig domain-containing protein [Geomonas paludis]|uniref:Uncharacterized protein n=1 Tax=Geomonas paludis TaxID=2740185 RepID=A0A6V8N269_9BACT|nr:CxxxxCH/CxxCH domain-containing protein [Geomonas paludis]GFO66084.1 hypothetical protein GMPD_40030 [Geomonas paludis]